MADGQVVLVTTDPLEGGSPVRSVYFVAEKDPETAQAIISAMMAPNEKVEAWGRLPEAAVKALGFEVGDFMQGWPGVELRSETARTETGLHPMCDSADTLDHG